MPPSHARVTPPDRGTGSVAYAGVPDAWWALREPPHLPAGELVFLDKPDKGYASLLAKTPPAVLPLRDLQQLVIDANIAAQLGTLPGVTLRETELRDPKGKVKTGYVLFDVAARVPLDRRHARATWQRGWLLSLEAAVWSDTAPLPPLFRLLDRPAQLFVRRDLAAIIAKAAKGKCTLDDFTDPGELFPPEWSLERLDTVGAPEAEAAFWACFAGDTGARPAALADPWWAYAVAMSIDSGARDDTRAAAAASPTVAVLYAANVDRAGHDITRAAARRHGLSAVRYASHVDLRLDHELGAAALDEAGHDASTIAELAGQLADLRGAPAPPPAPRRVTLAPATARYAEDHGPIDAAIRSDIDAFIPRGYARLGLAGEPRPEDVVDHVHRHVDAIRTRKLSAADRTIAQMEIGAAWGEQLHRALGWQWAKLAAGIALVSPDRAHAHYPFAVVGELLAKTGRRNTLALLFAMLAVGETPGGAAGSYTPVA